MGEGVGKGVGVWGKFFWVWEVGIGGWGGIEK
jgi:hypothetical protein